MKRHNLFRHCFSAIALSGVLFFAVSCSDQPAPGPMSPANSAAKFSALNTVRPLPRKSDEPKPIHRSLAKGAYTDDQLIATINQQPALSTGDLKAILLSESPLSESVLMAVLNRTTKMSTGDLKTVLLASTPLPASVEEAIQNLTTKLLSDGDISKVLTAQAGYPGHFQGTTVTKWITRKDGGTVWHGGHYLTVPAGALPQDSPMSITIIPSDHVQLELGPDGWFDKQVTVGISYKGVDLTSVDVNKLTLAWYDESGSRWISVDGGKVDTKLQRVIVPVWHFTQYTISTK